ncbi:hypothetical protein SeLEV6574_g07981 [Synchytrium endobioticum]|uniref:Uncharacterized protein n=1 Tax=Synchytrium endobioticum TaxID=286115 RepID=A0A507CFZ3_9FUNG|nr:hypothetical protein SeLEV6574_g07981 [Synchytrium endobioticum]
MAMTRTAPQARKQAALRSSIRQCHKCSMRLLPAYVSNFLSRKADEGGTSRDADVTCRAAPVVRIATSLDEKPPLSASL